MSSLQPLKMAATPCQFTVEPTPGTKHQRFLDHVRNGCNGDAAIYAYVLSWMARAVQMPGTTGEVAIVLRGARGTGKGIFAKIFGSLFGRHFWKVSDARHLNHCRLRLRDCIVLFADEIFGSKTSSKEDRVLDGVLKELLTEDAFVVEQMGVDAQVVPNHVHLIMSSNEQWIVPTSHTRRCLALDMTAAPTQDFGAINMDMKAGGLSNLLHTLQALDISAFDHRAVPQHTTL